VKQIQLYPGFLSLTKHDGDKMISIMKKVLSILFAFLFVSLPDQAQPPPASISGRTIINVGDTSILYGSPSGGTWSSANTGIATVDASGIVTGGSAGTVNIWYYPPLGSYYDNTYAIVTVKDPTYVSNNEQNIHIAVDIYPNPSATSLTITASTGINTISITNLSGQTFCRQQYDSKQVQVDVADFPAGIYLIRINDMAVRKFAKQ
jgi:type IX secretion system substrate protein/Big-like domain-containing protein